MRRTSITNYQHTPNVLRSLRGLVPRRRLQFHETLRLAELQANRLLELHGIDEAPVHESVIVELPRIEVRALFGLPISGSSHWNSGRWVATLNASESLSRQRFTLFHEFKHILDHGRTNDLYGTSPQSSAQTQAEHAANYFAGCALVPRRLLKRAWGEGVQRVDELAELFLVSPQAIAVRLDQVGLTVRTQRCRTALRMPSPRTHRYFRRVPAGGLAV